MSITHPQGNPQGKGLTPVLQDWRTFRPGGVEPKQPRRLFADYFTSLLVLSAEFHFKPVVGQAYHLYLKDGAWRLSLIEPERWGSIAGDYLGHCELHGDMTWSLQPVAALADNEALCVALQQFREQVLDQLDTDTPLGQQLPDYVAELPFYRRLAANGLAASMRLATTGTNLLARSGREWLALLPADSRLGEDDEIIPS